MIGKNLNRLRLILTSSSVLFVILFVSVLYNQGYLKRFDYQLYDLNFHWRGPEVNSGKVVLVLMDDRSSKELGKERSGWSRKQTAAALTNLCSADAEVVGMDLIYFSPDQNSEADVELARAMSECNNVILARVTSTLSGIEKSSLPIFQDAMIGDGFIDVPLDQDEVLRKIRFFNAKPLKDGSLQLLPSFALELARSYLFLDYMLDFSESDSFTLGNPQGDHIRLPYPELNINYSGNYTAFKYISFADVVNNSFSKDDVKGKIIILGSSLVTDKDNYTTPFSRAGLIPNSVKEKFGHVVSDVLGQKEYGVACHAHAVETILSGKFITRVDPYLVYSLIILLGFVTVLFYLPNTSISLEYLLFFLLVIAIVSSGYLLFIKKLLWLDVAPLLTIVCLQFIAGMVMQKAIEKKRNAMVTNLFGKYVSRDVVRKLLKGDIDTTLEGRKRDLTMLFSDLRNFTTMSEELGARDTTILLNTYFDAMLPLVFDHHGTLDKLMGDAIMCFFGSPLVLPDHADQAAMTALDMVKTLEVLRKSGVVKGIGNIDLGIGINSGEVTVGNLGSKEFMDYTIIGDAVNLASRLEGLNKVYGTHILISEFTTKELDDRFLLRELDLVRVKGKLKAITLYELIGLKSEYSADYFQMVTQFESGLVHFRNQKWKEAETVFLNILNHFPKDGPSRLYLDRIKRLREQPPPPEWDGVTIFGHK